MPTVLITGANRGLGLEFCRQYASLNWRVHATYRNLKAKEELDKLVSTHANITLHELDVSDFSAIDRLADYMSSENIDLLICNAGIFGREESNRFGTIDYTEWMDALVINAKAPVNLTEAFLPHLKRSERRIIVVMSSWLGSITDNKNGGFLIYRSSKAALNAAMKSLAIDLRKDEIGVLIMHPGWVRTDMGGPEAPVECIDSIAGMVSVIDNFRLDEDTGRFIDFEGKDVNW